MIKVLVLGADGQLGSDLIKIFHQNAINHVAVTMEQFNVLNDDIAKLDTYAATHIINCIATTDVDAAEINSIMAFQINANFAFVLSKFCVEKDITLVHISTDYIFDGTNPLKYDEKCSANPLNIYGLSKYAGEVAVKNYASKYFIFRVSSLFGLAGAAGKGGNFVTTMRRLGVEREQIKVISDQITCPTSTLDIARCIYHFIRNKIVAYGIYNCVSNNSCSWFEFTQEIFKLSNLDVSKVKKALFNEYSFKAKRPQYAVLDTSKLSQYYQMPTWQDALKEYIALLGK